MTWLNNLSSGEWQATQNRKTLKYWWRRLFLQVSIITDCSYNRPDYSCARSLGTTLAPCRTLETHGPVYKLTRTLTHIQCIFNTSSSSSSSFIIIIIIIHHHHRHRHRHRHHRCLRRHHHHHHRRRRHRHRHRHRQATWNVRLYM